MREQYSLIRIKDDHLYIIKTNLSIEAVASYRAIYTEDDCDRINPDRVYSISDTAMFQIFGR